MNGRSNAPLHSLNVGFYPCLHSCVVGGVFLFVFLFAGCAKSPSILEPEGLAAVHIVRLTWWLVGLGTAVYLLVMGFLAYALWHRRTMSSMDWDRSFILYGGVAFPAVLLVMVFGLTLNTQMALSDTVASKEVVIEVIGRQWWWEVHYPNQQIVGANEIHIPVGEPIEVKLTSADVIHSFWVPQLHGKLDLIPGKINTFWLQADEPGEYWGECAEFCGLQHARMAFLVVAEPPEAFALWLGQQSQPAPPPLDPLAQRGQDVFFSLNCAKCHTIQGTDAGGTSGPDLTHLASRRVIGAGTLPNSRGNLAGWVIDPHSVKPGNLMPATAVNGEDLQALLAYLENLK